MQREPIPIGDICDELLKLANSKILPEHTAESCKRAASLLTKIREVVVTATKGYPETMTQADAIALAKSVGWIMIENGE